MKSGKGRSKAAVKRHAAILAAAARAAKYEAAAGHVNGKVIRPVPRA